MIHDQINDDFFENLKADIARQLRDQIETDLWYYLDQTLDNEMAYSMQEWVEFKLWDQLEEYEA